MQADTNETTDQSSTPIATRRKFGAFASMLLVAPAVAGASDAAELDRELVSCCVEARSILNQQDAMVDPVEDLSLSDPRSEAAWAEASAMSASYHAAVERAIALPARTPEGLRAKADLVLLHLCDDGNGSEIALSLARDVLGRA